MRCSNCQTEMNKLEINDEYNTTFEIEHCPSCGGFWFDKNELRRLPIETCQRIDSPVLTKARAQGLQCPRDNNQLREFNDPGFRCPFCTGVFLSKGQLYAYEEEQKEKITNSIEFSKKTARGLSVLLIFFIFGLGFFFVSENRIRADELTYQAYQPVLRSWRDIFLFLSIITFLLLVMFEGIYLSKKKKRR